MTVKKKKKKPTQWCYAVWRPGLLTFFSSLPPPLINLENLPRNDFFLGDFQQYLIQWNPYTMKQFRFPSTHLAEHYSRISHRLGMNLTNSILFKVSQRKGKRRDMFGTIFCQTMVSALQTVITALVLDMNYILKKIFLSFNWRVIALQCCVGFCSTTMWISSKYTYVPSLLSLSARPHSHPTPLGHHSVSSWAPCY